MLSKEDNDLLTKVGPGTPANIFFKHIWLPFMLSESLIADGTPEKVELLGEKYIAFRDTDGNVGFMEEGCPHRGISLSLARNEKNALTCIFHGWSFNAKGECVSTPTEPNKDFCKKVRVRSFPTREAGGAIWVYLAPGEPARFPDYNYMYQKPERRYCRRGFVGTNWLNIVEGFVDSGHVGMLHKTWVTGVDEKSSLLGTGELTDPKVDLAITDYGFRMWGRRDRADGTSHVRVTEYMFPVTTQVATNENEIKFGPMCVPINDDSCFFWVFMWGTAQQVAEGGQTRMRNDPNNWTRDLVDRDKVNFGQDREAMKHGNWSGFRSLPSEDVAVGESMPHVDRTKEYLGPGDEPLIRLRRDILKHLHEIRDGLWKGMPDRSGVNYRGIRAPSVIVPANTDVPALLEKMYQDRIAAVQKEAAE